MGDGGANNGLASSDMVRFSDFYPSGDISIVDASDNVNPVLSNLQFADYASGGDSCYRAEMTWHYQTSPLLLRS